MTLTTNPTLLNLPVRLATLLTAAEKLRPARDHQRAALGVGHQAAFDVPLRAAAVALDDWQAIEERLGDLVARLSSLNLSPLQTRPGFAELVGFDIDARGLADKLQSAVRALNAAPAMLEGLTEPQDRAADAPRYLKFLQVQFGGNEAQLFLSQLNEVTNRLERFLAAQV